MHHACLCPILLFSALILPCKGASQARAQGMGYTTSASLASRPTLNCSSTNHFYLGPRALAIFEREMSWSV